MNISDLVDDIRVDMPSAPGPLILREVRHVLREFCEKTRAYRVDLEANDLEPTEEYLDLVLPTGYELIDLLEVEYDGSPLHPRTPRQLQKEYTNWRTQTGDPVFYMREGADQLRLVPIPVTLDVEAVTVRACLRPTRSATTFDDRLGEKYFEELASGARARMLSMPKKDWTDAATAGYHLGVFRGAIAEAAALAGDEGVKNVARKVKFRAF